MVGVEVRKRDTFTWELSREVALVWQDSFRKDFMNNEYWPEEYNFSTTPPISDYEGLLKQAKAFKRAVEYFTRIVYLRVRSSGKVVVVLIRDEDSREVTAFSLFTLPVYTQDEMPASFLYKLTTKLLSIWYKIQDIILFKSWRSPLFPAAMEEEFNWGWTVCQAAKTPERMEELQSMSRDELAKVSYPKEYNYYIGLFGVKSTLQGTGLGRLAMDKTIEVVRATGIQDPPFGGPAKIGLFSAPGARQFYVHYGFIIGVSKDRTLASGRVLPHTYFFMNLD